MLALAPLLTAGMPVGELEVSVTGLRNAKGDVHLCLTSDARHFPDCRGDPHAHTLSAAASAAGSFHFTGLPPGIYALSVIHDENGNGKLDTIAAIPKEGFGFSRNPAIHFGPPGFRRAHFTIGTGESRQQVRMRYFL